MIEPSLLPNVRGFDAPSLPAPFWIRNKAFTPLSTQSKEMRAMQSMKAMKMPPARMKPAMKAMKSMKSMTMRVVRMKPGERVGRRYCRNDGKVVEHKGSRYAPGSRRKRQYITKDQQIFKLRAKYELLVGKHTPCMEELIARRAEVEALNAKIEKFKALNGRLLSDIHAVREQIAREKSGTDSPDPEEKSGTDSTR